MNTTSEKTQLEFEQKTKRRGQFIINTLYLVLCIALAYLGLKYALPWLLPFLIGFLIAHMLSKPIQFIVKKTKLARGFVGLVFILLFYFLIISALVLLGINLFNVLEDVIVSFRASFSDVVLPAMKDLLDNVTTLISGFMPEVLTDLNTLSSKLLETLAGTITTVTTSLLDTLTNGASKLPKILMLLMFTILSSIFLTIDLDTTKEFLRRQIPKNVMPYVQNFRTYFLETIGKYAIGTLKLMGIIFLELSVGFLILGIENPFGVAVLTCLVDVLPILGTGTVLIPWAMIELLRGNLTIGVGLLILYGVIQLLRQFLEPRIIGKQLGLPPIATLFAMYVGTRLFGFVGFFGAPILLMVLLNFHKSGKIRLWK